MKFTKEQIENAVRVWLGRDNNEEKLIRGLNSTNRVIHQLGEALAEGIRPYLEVAERCLPDFLSGIASYQRWDLVCRSGWLPHETTPWAIITLDMKADHCSDLLEQHYQRHWKETKQCFLNAIADKNVDLEAKDSFSDALQAHENGLYRAVPRLLFPELERLFRVHKLENAKKTQVDKILKNSVNQLTVLELQDHGGFTFSGMEKLINHLYHQMWEDKPYPEAYTDPVPNRHAALHGFVTYKSPKNSFDMLVMCELAFGVISALNTRVG